jgi:hypothetical protein
MSLEVRGVGQTLGLLYGQLEDALRPVLGGLRWRVTLSEEGAWFRGGSGGGTRGAGWEVRLSRRESIALLVAASLGYLVVLAAVWILRRPLKVLLRLQDLHNLLLCTFSLVCFVFALRMMVVEGHFSSLRAAVCQPIRDPAFELLSLLFLLSKFWEWFDTVLLIVKGSEVRFLHVLHHMTTAVLYAVDHTFPSSIKYGVMVNALVVSGRFPSSSILSSPTSPGPHCVWLAGWLAGFSVFLCTRSTRSCTPTTTVRSPNGSGTASPRCRSSSSCSLSLFTLAYTGSTTATAACTRTGTSSSRPTRSSGATWSCSSTSTSRSSSGPS